MPTKCYLKIALLCLLAAAALPAAAAFPAGTAVTLKLKNGDMISGDIVSRDKERLVILSPVLGEVGIRREFVLEIIEHKAAGTPPEEKDKSLWKRNLSFGYSRTGGNTNSSRLSTQVDLNRKTGSDEFTAQGKVSYSSADRKMHTQRWYGMLRYAYSFWDMKWYNFYKLESDHDRFASIDYRITPSVGIGYWFSDKAPFKAMAELGIGFEHTHFNNNVKDADEAILIPRIFLEKTLFSKSRLSQEVAIYPSLEDSGDYRLRSETAFINPLDDRFSLKVSFIDEYDSNPPPDTKKNDTRLVSSLVYSF